MKGTPREMPFTDIPHTANSTSAEKTVNSSAHLSERGRALKGSSEAVSGAGGVRVGDEQERTRLIDEISRVIRDPTMPESTRSAGLTLIGWLARRMPGEQAHALGVHEARESEARLKAARQKLR